VSNDKPLILVVDDEPDIRELIKDILEDETMKSELLLMGRKHNKFLTNNSLI